MARDHLDVRRAIACFSALSMTLSTVSAWVPARAEPSAEDRALATSLFKQGKTLMDAGDLTHACPKLEESQRLDPSSGTILNVALCHERQGRTATAWTDFSEALAMARRDGRDDRIGFAEVHIAALEPKLSRLVIIVAAEADEPTLRVLRDGSPIGRAAWGGAIPVDPGKHTIEASATGKTKWRTVVEVGPNADARTVTIPKLLDAPIEPTVSSATGASSTRTAGIALSAIGIAWMGAGTFLGLRAFAKRRDSDRECINGCTVRGATLNDDARVAADASTASFALGLASLGVGAYLFFRSSEPSAEPRAAHIVPSIGPQHGSVFLTGSF